MSRPILRMLTCHVDGAAHLRSRAPWKWIPAAAPGCRGGMGQPQHPTLCQVRPFRRKTLATLVHLFPVCTSGIRQRSVCHVWCMRAVGYRIFSGGCNSLTKLLPDGRAALSPAPGAVSAAGAASSGGGAGLSRGAIAGIIVATAIVAVGITVAVCAGMCCKLASAGRHACW